MHLRGTEGGREVGGLALTSNEPMQLAGSLPKCPTWRCILVGYILCDQKMPVRKSLKIKFRNHIAIHNQMQVYSGFSQTPLLMTSIGRPYPG